jgi:hypothetical protein
MIIETQHHNGSTSTSTCKNIGNSILWNSPHNWTACDDDSIIWRFLPYLTTSATDFVVELVQSAPQP